MAPRPAQLRVGGHALLDLPYEEDARAEVDLNVVMNASGKIVELQGTAESAAFSRSQLDEMIELASGGIAVILGVIGEAISQPPEPR